MGFLQRLSVGGRLALGFSAVLLFMVAVAGFSIYQLSLIGARSAEIANVHLSGVRDALLISESATRYRVREYRLAMTKHAELGSVIKRMDQAVEAVNKHRKSFESSIASDQQRTLYADFASAWQTYLATSARMKDRLQASDTEAAMGIMTTDSLKHFDAVVAALKAMSEFNDQAAQTASSEAVAMSDRARNLILLVVAGAIGLGVLLSIVISRAVTRPLKQALGLAEAVAAGNLTHQLQVTGHDEVAQLTRALTKMVSQLRSLVTEVRSGVHSVSMASSEIAVGSHDLSSRTEEAAASLQQTASAMEQLTGTMSHAADTAQQANQLASHATGSARKGGDVVARVVQNMSQITESSRKIGDIIGVIDGIAFQTNILALNAAVEAARAGEQGRGFAVVASEVRTLAQRSAQAAKEIKGLINASVETVDSGAQLVNDAGTVMSEIVGSVQRVTDLMGELAAAASEQKTGIGQVNTAVNQLDQMTQQNAALVEETAAAASSLSEQAVRLSQVVSVFNTGEEPPVVEAARQVIRKVQQSASQPSARSSPGKAGGAPASAGRSATVSSSPTKASVASGSPLVSPTASRRPASATTTADAGDWESF